LGAGLGWKFTIIPLKSVVLLQNDLKIVCKRCKKFKKDAKNLKKMQGK